jgi:hypothetical protein
MTITLSRKNISKVLICDDIRVENNGKYILIGVYTDDILVSSLPATLSFMTYLQIRPDDVGEANIRARVCFGRQSKKNVAPIIEIKAVFKNKETAQMALPKVSFTAQKEEVYRVDVSFDGRTWVNLSKTPIRLMQYTTSPTFSPPPFPQSPHDGQESA